MNKNFQRFLIVWAGQFISAIGAGLTGFAVGVHVFQETGSATNFAMVLLCSFLPAVLLRPLGGVLADRFDRRLMMLAGDTGSALSIAGILLAVLSGYGMAFVYMGLLLNSSFVALQNPAYKACVTDMLTEDEYSKAGGLMQLASSAQYLFSPAIAGFLMSVTGIGTVLLINACTYVLAALAVLVVRKQDASASEIKEKHSLVTDLKEGWHAVSSDKSMLVLIAVLAFVTFCIGFLQTLIGPLLLTLTDEKTYGIVQSVAASAMLITSLYLGMAKQTGGFVAMFKWGLLLAGLFFMLIGVSVNLWVIGSAAFLFFAMLPFVNTSADVLMRKHIDSAKQGRVWSIVGVLTQIGYVAAYAVSGLLADYVFNPLLTEGGALSGTLGRLIGTGPARGIGFLFIIAGLAVLLTAVAAGRNQAIKELEQ